MKSRNPRRKIDQAGNAAWGVVFLLVVGAAAFAYFHFKGRLPWDLKGRPTPVPYKTVEEGKREALRRYPALGTAGTRLNQDFVARYNLYRQQRPEFFQSPGWPVELAEEVARSLESPPQKTTAPSSSATATTSDKAGIPEHLKAPFEILLRTYPQVDAKKFPKAPADSVWLFRSFGGQTGTVEVAFQEADVVYMLFRRGVGGKPWTLGEAYSYVTLYHDDLLKGKFYSATVINQIRAAAITRSDFDPQQLRTGQ